MAKKQLIRLTESDLHNIIKESVNKVLKEETESRVINKIQDLITQANNAYNEAKDYIGDDSCLMDKNEDGFYGLNKNIYLDKRGNIVIPFNNDEGTVKIKVVKKINGKITLIKGDFYTEGWNDAKKILNKIIRDAKIGIGYFQNYDSSWEYSETPEERKTNINNLKQMNKSIGRKANAGMDYLY